MSRQHALQNDAKVLTRGDINQLNRLLSEAVSSYQATSSVRLSNKQVETLRKNAQSASHQCLEIDRNCTDALNILARIALDQHKHKQAERWAKSALAIDPASATTWYTLGQIRLALNELPGAEQAFAKCIELDNTLFRAHTSYAFTKLQQGNLVVAFQYYRKLARVNPSDPHVRSKLFECLKQLKADFDNPDLAADLCDYFDWEDVNYNDLSNTTASLLKHRYQVSDPEAVVDIATMCQDPLLLKAMKKLILHDQPLEVFLTQIRQFLLLSELQNPTQQSNDLLTSFAWQAYNNEYAFAEAAQETEVIEQLQNKLASLSDREIAAHANELILYLMYRPITDLYPQDKLKALASLEPKVWPVESREFFEEVLEDYYLEAAAPIKTLGEISNPVSKAVKGQYEMNPYPRWLALDYHTPTNYSEALETTLKGFKAPAILKQNPINVLVAGCGTGRHALNVARYFRDVEVLAIDISSKSLEYAQKMARYYDIENVSFLQADILELAQLNRKFDIIECSGVLHHMESPSAGAKVLESLLTPKGIMKIGLYSERARGSVVKCREHISHQHYSSSPEGIRQLRQDILNHPENSAWKDLLGSPDFYNLSGCRDLVFHVQEHRFTPLQLEQLVDDLGLKFLGFTNLNQKVVSDYLKMNPQDPYMKKLKLWDRFEQEHPSTFAAMYQFYLQKG